MCASVCVVPAETRGGAMTGRREVGRSLGKRGDGGAGTDVDGRGAGRGESL